MASLYGLFKLIEDRIDDDFSDRLNHRFTGIICIIFAVLVSTTQYVGNPIACWAPVHFSGAHEKYADDYCWISNTYYLPMDENIPHEHEDEKRHMIPYYQWLPLILLLQAFMFNIPIVMWRNLASKSGLDVNNIVDAAKSFENDENRGEKDETLDNMTKQLDRYLDNNQNDQKTGATISLKHCFSRTCCFCFGHSKGNYLATLYLFIKFLFVLNVIGQLFLMNVFLGTRYSSYGIDVIRALIAGEDWTESDRFPRITLCDFKVRRLGNIQRYTLQCVLQINLFNEKIYLFLWWWFVFVATVSVFSFFLWFTRYIYRVDRYKYIKKHIAAYDGKMTTDQKRNLVKFVEKYFKQDGVFVMQLVGHNTNRLTIDEITGRMFEIFKAREKILEHGD